MTPRLPDVVVAFLEWLVPDPISRAGLIGDLEERYAHRGGGGLRRRLWLGTELLAVAIHYTREGRTTTMDALRHDLRFVMRSLVRRKGFSLLVLGTIALGIGANTAIFSVVNGLLLEPLPFAEGDRLALVNQRNETGFTSSVSFPNYRDWKDRSRAFERLSAILPSSTSLAGDDGTRVIEVAWVHGGFFETLGVEPTIGRFFSESESDVGATRLVVLSHGLWIEEFGGDPDAIGRTVELRAEPYTVVGVAPPELTLYGDTRAFLPLGYVAEGLPWEDRGTGVGTELVGRLAPDATFAQASAELVDIGRDIEAEYGEDPGIGNVTPLRAWFVGDTGRQSVMLMAAVALVLLVACVNVANLLLVAGERRRGEIAVRSALGAGRARVYRQLLTESLVYGVLGGGCGVALGYLGLDALLAVSADTLPQGFGDRVRIDGAVLAFATLLSVGTALLAGFVPALRSARTGLARTLRAAGRDGSGSARLRGLLIGVEVALSMVLLVGAGLLMVSLGRLQSVDKGFDGSDVLTLRVQAPGDSYPDRERWAGLHRRLRDEVHALPGVSATATSNHFPLSGNSWEMLYKDERTPPDDRGESVLLTMVSPDFFATYDIDIVRGRNFTEDDRWGDELVTIVDETLAEARWPGEDPLGRRVTFEQSPDAEGEMVDVWRTVVGVASHVRHYELTEPSRIEAYTPIGQSVAWGFTSYLSVRASTDLPGLVPRIRQLVAEIDPDVPLYRIRTLESVVDQRLGIHRAMRELLLVMAGMTLLLGCIGIYSVVSHTTSLRIREIGVRIVLGAAPRRMTGLVVRDSAIPVVAGIVAGAVGAAALARLLGSLLFEVGPADPLVLTGAGVTILVVAVASAWIPARRVARIDPTEALAAE